MATASAGVYDTPFAGKIPGLTSFLPSEKLPFQIRENGSAQELEFGSRNDGEFPARLGSLGNIADRNPRRKENPDRQAILARIAERKKISAPTPHEIAGLAADLMRVGLVEEAINRLQPLSRGRSAGFVVLMNLAHAHALRGEWNEAIQTHEVALEYDPADELTWVTPAQARWLARVEKTYYRRWLMLNRDSNPRRPVEADEPLALFDKVRFVNEAGGFEPGSLAAASKTSLPEDAVAVVQQMLLWQPADTNLYWLLAELYAARNRLRTAAVIYDQVAWSRQYSNRRVMMDHRDAVKKAVDLLPPEAAEGIGDLLGTPPSDEDGLAFLPSRQSVILVLAVFVPIAILLFILQFRAIRRRLARP